MSRPQPASKVDIVVVGSGFSGCIMALILNRIGFSVVVVDKARHPRMAIGESSTPAADFVLADLARKYNLPRLLPLSQYAALKKTYPNLGCGLKRGFSYFQHHQRSQFKLNVERSNELLVAASADERSSDSHWFRQDVDAFLADEVRSAEIPLFEETQVFVTSDLPTWQLKLVGLQAETFVESQFMVDASGGGQFLAKHFKFEDQASQLLTNTTCSYGHFRNVAPFHSILQRSGSIEHHPFPCDSGATHHLFDRSWMWDLRFDNGIASIGIVQNAGVESQPLTLPEVCSHYPSIESMFANAEPVRGTARQSTGRLQRLSPQITGKNWAMLPTTAGFIDPLHSTGIAHAMIGIERLTSILQRSWNSETLVDELADYESTVRAELKMIDRLVSVCYSTMGRFSHFVTATMLYFAAVSTWEFRRKNSPDNNEPFLLADEDEFVWRCNAALEAATSNLPPDEFSTRVRELIAPYNTVGLLSDEAGNMYEHTAAR